MRTHTTQWEVRDGVLGTSHEGRDGSRRDFRPAYLPFALETGNTFGVFPAKGAEMPREGHLNQFDRRRGRDPRPSAVLYLIGSITPEGVVGVLSGAEVIGYAGETITVPVRETW